MDTISQLPVRGQVQTPANLPLLPTDKVTVFQGGMLRECTVADLAAPFVLTQAIVDAIMEWTFAVQSSPAVDIRSTGNMSIGANGGNLRIGASGGDVMVASIPVINGGATGTFTSADGKTVTVQTGVIISIV